MTVRLAVSVEGPTEQEFCRNVIAPHLRQFNIYAEAKVVVTKRVISGPNFKGGAVSTDRVVNEIRPLLHSFDYVTTLYDFYRFRGREPGEDADQLCQRIADRLANPQNLIPYVQVYEFEALLFSAPDIVGRHFDSAEITQEMQRVLQSVLTPEQINDGEATAPSKRLQEMVRCLGGVRYDKKFHGPQISSEIGLDAIRAACPRFAKWLQQLEAF